MAFSNPQSNHELSHGAVADDPIPDGTFCGLLVTTERNDFEIEPNMD